MQCRFFACLFTLFKPGIGPDHIAQEQMPSLKQIQSICDSILPIWIHVRVPNSVAKMINWGYASDMTDQKFFPYQAMTDAPLTPLPAPRLALTAWAAALTQWPHTVICSSTEVPRHNLLNPTPISKSAPHHLCHHHLLITTRSAARDLLSDMATRRVFHLDSPTHVFQP